MGLQPPRGVPISTSGASGKAARSVVTASAGNHGQGVALAARVLGISARIYMPRSTPRVKQNAVRQHGGEFVQILLAGDSYDKYAKGYGIQTKDAMAWFRDHYLRSREDASDWRASPIKAPSLAGAAPVIVITAECDVLHDDGQRYAEALRLAGVPVEYKEYPGMIHAFFGEREDVKLAYAQSGVPTAESPAAHDEPASAQALAMAPLAVPNTVEQGSGVGQSFLIAFLTR